MVTSTVERIPVPPNDNIHPLHVLVTHLGPNAMILKALSLTVLKSQINRTLPPTLGIASVLPQRWFDVLPKLLLPVLALARFFDVVPILRTAFGVLAGTVVKVGGGDLVGQGIGLIGSRRW